MKTLKPFGIVFFKCDSIIGPYFNEVIIHFKQWSSFGSNEYQREIFKHLSLNIYIEIKVYLRLFIRSQNANETHDIYIGFWWNTPSPVNLSKLLFYMDPSKTYALKEGIKDWWCLFLSLHTAVIIQEQNLHFDSARPVVSIQTLRR